MKEEKKKRNQLDFKVIHGGILGGMEDHLESVYQLVGTYRYLV